MPESPPEPSVIVPPLALKFTDVVAVSGGSAGLGVGLGLALALAPGLGLSLGDGEGWGAGMMSFLWQPETKSEAAKSDDQAIATALRRGFIPSVYRRGRSSPAFLICFQCGQRRQAQRKLVRKCGADRVPVELARSRAPRRS